MKLAFVVDVRAVIFLFVMEEMEEKTCWYIPRDSDHSEQTSHCTSIHLTLEESQRERTRDGFVGEQRCVGDRERERESLR